jgi:mannose-1-phosphate guanylyltransferase
MNVVIMAGGGGSRLWPLSRQNKPKQFLDLGSGKTLLEHAWERALVLTKPENVYVATTLQYAPDIRRLLPQVVEKNMMYEPERKDTGPAFAAAATTLEHMGQGDEPTIFMWSDHMFTNEAELLEDLKKIPSLLKEYPESVVIAGHIPLYPETGLGYFQVGQPLPGHKDVYQVEAFKEKPDKETAQKYVMAGNYFWNMAYISVRPSYLLKEIGKHAPDLMKQIAACREAIIQGNSTSFAKAYAKCQPISIDYVLLEKTPNIIAVTGDYGWSDVGNWGAVKDVFGVTGDHVPAGHHVHVDDENNYIYNATDKVCSIIGLRDTIVVITDDAILVTHKDTTHKVKDVVLQLTEEGRKEFL